MPDLSDRPEVSALGILINDALTALEARGALSLNDLRENVVADISERLMPLMSRRPLTQRVWQVLREADWPREIEEPARVDMAETIAMVLASGSEDHLVDILHHLDTHRLSKTQSKASYRILARKLMTCSDSPP
jgi:hypothetical protein